MPAIFEYLHTVVPTEIDEQGHVNNLEFIRWMQTAALGHSAAQGWPGERYRDRNEGFVARSHSIEYLQSAYVGDEIIVLTWIADFARVTSRRKYKIKRLRDDVTLAKAETNWAYISLTKRLPTRIPQELSNDFIIVPVEEEP
ncbi:MAG: acyl-CoA thioesterase [Planctomycetota bacterium]|nr:acyl-CoA thioesterase [Planctomycetota bacterium]